MNSLRPLHVATPLLEPVTLNRRLQRRLYFKMECNQPTGSFKLRGMGHLMSRRAAEGSRHFVCSSGGNAGLAVAYCAAKLNVTAQVILPSTTPKSICQSLEALGAEVRVIGAVWDEADTAARKISLECGATYVSPFNDPLLWEGHSTLVDEIAGVIERPDAVVVSVGGGGLLCGVLLGMHRHGWNDVPVIAAETEGAASFAAAMEAGAPISIGKITSTAKSLGALRVCDEAYAWTKRHEIRSTVVSDRAALMSCVSYADEMRVLVEPACAVGLAAVEQAEPCLNGCARVLIIACGGAGVSSADISAWRDQTR